MKAAALCLAFGVFSCRAPAADCPNEAGWRDDHVAVFSRSILTGTQLERGALAACHDQTAGAAFRAARAARNTTGQLAPDHVSVHVDVIVRGGAAIDRIETHASGVLVAAAVSPSAWIHELAHVAIGRPSIVDSPGARFAAAAEEGLADHVARIVGTPVDRPRRDGPASTSAGFEALALLDLRFDPHPLGEQMSVALADVRDLDDPAVFASVMKAFGETATSTAVGANRDRWLARCPPSARPHLQRALMRWLPKPLWAPAWSVDP